MSRLIDADKLRLSYWVSPTSTVSTAGQYYFYSQEEVDNAPTIDAEPVIKCKDCMYADSYYHCTWTNFWGTADDYCSRAKPKMDSNDSNDSNALNALEMD